MCTAVSFNANDHYFGRNLDLEYHYEEQVVITPRKYPFRFRCENSQTDHYAIIGMATVVQGFPLYYDATNEYGLSIAGLNFPRNAHYNSNRKHCVNIAPFELIPWILCQCQTLSDVRKILTGVNIIDLPFSDKFQNTPLHWMVSDRTGSLVIEPMLDGIKIFDNPINVLTNNPPFPYHLSRISEFMQLTRDLPVNHFARDLHLECYSNGMGALGLPGDLSSSSRFVRAAFVLHNSVSNNSEYGNISQFFHILDSVAQQRGCVNINDHYEITYYSSCCNTSKGIYYYKTYDNSQLSAVDMHRVNLNSNNLIMYPLVLTQQIHRIN